MKEIGNRKRSTRYMGTVTKWFRDRKYGFVQSWEDGKSYFVHISQVADKELMDGATVEFEVWHNKQDYLKVFAAKVLVVEVPE